MTVRDGEGQGVKGLSKKEKELMRKDCSVVIAGGEEGIRELNCNGKNIIKIHLKKYQGEFGNKTSGD